MKRHRKKHARQPGDPDRVVKTIEVVGVGRHAWRDYCRACGMKHRVCRCGFVEAPSESVRARYRGEQP